MASETAGTISRVIKLMRCLAEVDGDVSITELSRTVELAPSTVHRLLHLLLQEGIVARSEARSLYQPGMEFIRLGALVSQRLRIDQIALNFMKRVTEQAGEACMLVQPLPHDDKVMVVAAIPSPHPLRYDIEMFQGSSMLQGATGLSILSFLEQGEVDRILAEVEEPAARKRLTDEIERVRTQGFALTHGQKIPGAVGIGAPVFDAQGHVVAALCVTLPEQRFEEKRADALASLVADQALSLSQTLGYRGGGVRTTAQRPA